ncbi:MAG: HEAT repeat domain-containing protein [Planctomycetota bacterium]
MIESAATLLPAARSSWWERAEVTDVVRTDIGGTSARVRRHATLEAVPDGFDPDCALASTDSAEVLLRQPAPAYKSEEAASGSPTPGRAGPEDRKRFLALLAAYTGGDGTDTARVHALAEMLAAFPEFAAEIPRYLARDDLAEYVAAGLAHALQLAGNPACQQALGQVASGDAYPHKNRIRGIVALGGVEEPTPDAVDALWKLTERRGPDADEDQLGSTAVLALGRAGERLRKAENPRYKDLRAGLRANLARSAGLQKTEALLAMSSTGDPELLPDAAPELDAREPNVRAAAARAVGATDRPEALEHLVDRLEREPDSWVRRSLLDGMGRISATSDDACARCLELLRTERDKQVRFELVKYLGDNLESYPASRETLEALLNDRRNSNEMRIYLKKKLHAGITGFGKKPRK